ncbi:MAG: hypothetical protein Ct9H300mP28_34230 [Pseudomonadota bacterium]|nr:MAG: hypothetical protein Ct9H300mP28_34230 [Pseudomonadota bacterium]
MPKKKQDYDDAFSVIECSEDKLEILHITDLTLCNSGDQLLKKQKKDFFVYPLKNQFPCFRNPFKRYIFMKAGEERNVLAITFQFLKTKNGN